MKMNCILKSTFYTCNKGSEATLGAKHLLNVILLMSFYIQMHSSVFVYVVFISLPSRLKLESVSPACMSMKSDHSMDQPTEFSSGREDLDSR